MTPDEERWAEVFIAERIGTLALEGDVQEIRRWKQIAARLDALAVAAPVPQ